jgi:hypothetical protein
VRSPRPDDRRALLASPEPCERPFVRGLRFRGRKCPRQARKQCERDSVPLLVIAKGLTPMAQGWPKDFSRLDAAGVTWRSGWRAGRDGIREQRARRFRESRRADLPGQVFSAAILLRREVRPYRAPLSRVPSAQDRGSGMSAGPASGRRLLVAERLLQRRDGHHPSVQRTRE